MKATLTLPLLFSITIAVPGLAQLPAPPDGKEALSKAYAGKAYSPYVGRDFPERPLWGNSHLHSSLSMDAGGFGNRRGPDEAY
jgi:hypothetical protein